MDLDDHVRGACPLWDAWNIIAEGGVVHLMDKNTEKTSGLFVLIGLELGVDLDN